MAQMLPPLIAVLQADIAGFQAKMAAVKAEAAATTGVAGTAFTGMAGLGKVALLGIGAAAIAGGALALKMGGDYQEAMTQLVTGAGESKANLALVSKGILDMAGQVGMSASDLAKGMYMIESAGFHGAGGLEVLKVAAEGAKVGNADMATVADALTSALNAYHLPASQATAVTNDLIATVASGKMHMQDLAGALGTVLPAASTARVSLAEVTGAIATMTMQGTPAADAATYLRQTLLQMENPSAKAQKALADVGLSSKQLANDLGTKGLAATLQEATDAIGKKFTPGSAAYIAHLADMVGGTKSMQAALELTGGNMAAFRANIASINGQVAAGGKTVQGWADVQGDFNFKVTAAKDGLMAMVTSIGMQLIPYAEKAMDLTAQWAGWLAKHREVAVPLALAIGGILVVAIAAYTVAMIGAAVATLAATWPILAIIAAVALLAVGAYEVYTHWAQLSKFFTDEWNAAMKAVGGMFSDLGTKIHDFLAGIVDAGERMWHEFSSRPVYWIAYMVVGVLNGLNNLTKMAGAWLVDLGNMLVAGIGAIVISQIRMFQQMPGAVGQVFSDLGSVVHGGVDMVVHYFEDMWNRAGDSITHIDWGGLGMAIIRGITGGLIGGSGSLIGEMQNIAGQALQGAKDALGIHSPSAVFAQQVGLPMVQGMAEGVSGNASLAVNAVRGAASGSTSGLSSSGGGGTGGGVTIVINAGTVVGRNGMQELADLVGVEVMRSVSRNHANPFG